MDYSLVKNYLDAVWTLAAAMGEVSADSVRSRFENTIWSRVRLGPEVGLKEGFDKDKIAALKSEVRPTMVEYARGDRKADAVQRVPANRLIPTQEGVSSRIVLDYAKAARSKLPVVVAKDGNYYIWDGHHRTVADVIQGRDPEVNVIRF